MEITLEKIELVRDRTGVSYKEAKDALAATDGNVIEAIIAIESSVDRGEPMVRSKAESNKTAELIEKVKTIISKGNVAKVIITKDETTLLNLPLTAGIVGAVLAPWAVIAGLVASLGFKCKIEFVREDGSIVDLSEKAGDLYDAAKEKGQDIYFDIKEKAPGAIDEIVGKGSEALNKAKDAAEDIAERIVRAGKAAGNEFADLGDELSDLGEELEEDLKEELNDKLQ